MHREEYQFVGDQNTLTKAVIFYPDLGGSKPIRHCPLIIVNPGYSDNSAGLDYLGENLALAGFYVVSYDPQDGLDFLPQGEPGNVQINWPVLSDRLMLLHDNLVAAGYPVSGSNPRRMLDVVKECLEGSMTDQNELDVCKQFFNYRLNPAQVIINACKNRSGDLPGSDLVETSWIGSIGYSLGGFTSLQLSGADHSLPDPSVNATLLVAPVTGLFTPDDLAQVDVPVMCIKAGQDETAINGPLENLWPFFPEPKELVVYPDFGHLDFTETFDYLLPGPEEIQAAKRAKVAEQAVKFFTTQYESIK